LGIVDIAIDRVLKMGILDKISDKFSLATVHPEVEVLDKYIFHQVPFKVRVKLVAGNKKIKINQLEVDLIWDEMKMPESIDLVPPYMRSINMSVEGHEKHMIYKQKTRDPVKLDPHGYFSFDLTFNTEKAIRYRRTDNFYLRVIVDIPKGPDIRDRKDIEVLPHLVISAPLVTMMEKLRFNRKHLDLKDIESGHWNQWLLYPMEGTYSHLDEVLVTVDETEKRELVLTLDMNMCEEPHSEDQGITEVIRDSFIIHPDDIVDQNNIINMDFLSHNIHYLLIEAEKHFYQTMVVNRGSPINL